MSASTDVRLINTPGAVLIGIVYGYLPLMVLPIYVSLEKLDKRLLEASADLGATPVRPSSGDAAAVAARRHDRLHAGLHPAAGRYILPQFLGGGKVFFIGNALVDLFLQSRNWPFGSAIAVALVLSSWSC